ncbi:hypothetical protein D9M68_970150 [compost metagenome]
MLNPSAIKAATVITRTWMRMAIATIATKRPNNGGTRPCVIFQPATKAKSLSATLAGRIIDALRAAQAAPISPETPTRTPRITAAASDTIHRAAPKANASIRMTTITP